MDGEISTSGCRSACHEPWPESGPTPDDFHSLTAGKGTLGGSQTVAAEATLSRASSWFPS